LRQVAHRGTKGEAHVISAPFYLRYLADEVIRSLRWWISLRDTAALPNPPTAVNSLVIIQ
jgi:hypothetical protein